MTDAQVSGSISAISINSRFSILSTNLLGSLAAGSYGLICLGVHPRLGGSWVFVVSAFLAAASASRARPDADSSEKVGRHGPVV